MLVGIVVLSLADIIIEKHGAIRKYRQWDVRIIHIVRVIAPTLYYIDCQQVTDTCRFAL
jgi:hypothetical protein